MALLSDFFTNLLWILFLFNKQKLRIKGKCPGVLEEVLTNRRKEGPTLPFSFCAHLDTALLQDSEHPPLPPPTPQVSWAFRLTHFVTTPVLSSVIKGPFSLVLHHTLSICNLHLSNFGHTFCKSLIAHFPFFLHLLLLPSEAHTPPPEHWGSLPVLPSLICSILSCLSWDSPF